MIYISPQQFEAAMTEVNAAFAATEKRIDLLLEKIQSLEEANKANPSKEVKSK
tara:strand:+ start:33 stop:191 length:159 start_codon:yes stop_codon:yes gene_type:complete